MLGCVLLVTSSVAAQPRRYDVSTTTKMASPTNGSIIGMACCSASKWIGITTDVSTKGIL
jgi:hypothetical protein